MICPNCGNDVRQNFIVEDKSYVGLKGDITIECCRCHRIVLYSEYYVIDSGIPQEVKNDR